VHAAISTNDALTASRANIRSAGPKHDAAVQLFLRYFTDEGSEEAGKDLKWLIGKKSTVEYEARAFKKRRRRRRLSEPIVFWSSPGAGFPPNIRSDHLRPGGRWGRGLEISPERETYGGRSPESPSEGRAPLKR